MVVTSAPESTARPLPAVSADSVSSAPPSTRRASSQPTKASAGSTSKSARKSPTKSAAGPSRRAPRNSAASPSSTSTIAPAPTSPGSARRQRASALNARAINNLELQALEASDAEVLGWSPPVLTPTPAPVVTPASQRQSSSDDSADDEVALQRSRRLRKKSVVESNESSDSVAEALEEKPASPLTPVPVLPAPSTGQKHISCPVLPAPSTGQKHIYCTGVQSKRVFRAQCLWTSRASTATSGQCACPNGTSMASKARPAAKSSKAAKSATKTARGTAKSCNSAKSATPTTPASGQSASASGTAAVSAPTSSASSGQASNSAGGATSLPDGLRLPILMLRTRAAQAVSRDSRVPVQMKIWCDPPFFHLSSAPRCWDQVMGSCVVEIQKETVDGKPRVRSTPSSLSLATFADVYAAQHPSQCLMCWLKCRGDRQEMAKVFVALYERMHWLVDSSVVLGLHPDLNPASSADELALAYQLWQKYSHERKRRSDALRSVLTELYGTLYKAVTEFDAASNTPAPQLDSELYFDPSVPFAPPANLPWFPTSADWCEAAFDIDVG
ncbi:unnamed protein product [Phytophthora fragariaefolia]|uniref:Unnamed protein product n=1 Tax=Phytophthora fragariaefolia TaxID=1490495 RepID=A0A9W6XB35_9STRA|nr:unnamed protein product [Phytophthora fragariaefolia]